MEMSQHKFASNVVEKCLQHGSHSDRQILISEIMGRSEENGPLQMMMKDQFGNYVVQKLLEVKLRPFLGIFLSRGRFCAALHYSPDS